MQHSTMMTYLASARNNFDDVSSMLLEQGDLRGNEVRAMASAIHAAINELRNKEQL